MDDLTTRVFSLPLEILVSLAWDAPTLVRLQLAAISRRDERRFWLLDQQWKKMGAKPREAFQVLEKFQENSVVDQLIKRLLRPYTLQRQIRELFEGGLHMRGYLLFKTLPDGDIGNYILDNYFPSVLRSRVELKEWDIIREDLFSRKTLWRAFEAYRSLDHEQQREVRANLDDRRNLLAEFLIDSEGTEVDDWTDELIKNWLTISPIHDTKILELPVLLRVKAVRNLLYYSHNDPRYRRRVRGFKVIPHEMNRDMDPPETIDDILASFRGNEKDFEQLLLQAVREWSDLHLGEIEFMELDGDEILRRFLDRGYKFSLSVAATLPFYQYPNLVEKYRNILYFSDEILSSSDFERIFDLIDYQESLQVLRYYTEDTGHGHDWIRAVYGVEL
jgi:hypothetical protein